MRDLQSPIPSNLDLSIDPAPTHPGVLGSIGLEESHIGAWVGRLDEVGPMGAWERLLSPAELERAARFRFEEDRQRYVYGRGLLRELAGSYLGAQPKHLEFSYTANGKPQLTSASKDQGLSFNLSHSGARLLLAFAWNREVGVDVELVRRDVETSQIAQRYFSQAEQRGLLALESAEQIPAFFRCWTRKEAYVKAVGGGLSLPLSQFDVSLLPDEPAELLATRPDPAEAARWVLWNLDLGPDYAAALAVSQRPQVPRPSQDRAPRI